MSEDISLGQFKEQVLRDYRVAYMGREARRAAMVEADCHYVTALSDVAQAALARFAEAEDAYISAGLDLTAELALGRQTPSGFFRSLFTSAGDVFSRGLPSRMAVAVGMALADASLRAAGGRGRIIICTACGDFGADGDFLESVCFAAARSLPLCAVLWNNSGTTSNGNLIRQLGGFGQVVKGRRTLAIEAVKGGDYAALCRVMATQTERTRQGTTTLTFVSGCESEMEAFATWLEEKRIATRQQTAAIEADARQEVERDRRGAYLTSLVADAPLRHPHRQLTDLAAILPRAARPVMPLRPAPGIVNKAIGAAVAGILPVAEITAADVRASLLMSYPSAELILRTTDIETGGILSCTSDKTEIWTPACHAEAQEAYATLLSRPRQAIVIEPGAEAAEAPTPPPSRGGAAKLTEGEDVTLLSFGPTTQPAADAVKLLARQNTRVEHIHLHTLRPLDSDGAVTASLRKTKRLAIVDADPTGLTARLIVAELALRPDAMRHLMTPPNIIRPQSGLRPAEPHDICVGISAML